MYRVVPSEIHSGRGVQGLGPSNLRAEGSVRYVVHDVTHTLGG